MVMRSSFYGLCFTLAISLVFPSSFTEAASRNGPPPTKANSANSQGSQAKSTQAGTKKPKKASPQSKALVCQDALTAPMEHRAGLRVPVALVDEVRDEAAQAAEKIIHMIVENSWGALSREASEGSLQSFRIGYGQTRRTGDFLNSRLLNRKQAIDEQHKKVTEEVGDQVTSLVEYLDRFKALSSGKGKMAQFLNSVPFVRNLLSGSATTSLLTLEEQIREMGQSIENGIATMEENNSALLDLRGEILTELKSLQRDIVLLDLVKEQVEGWLTEAEHNTQIELNDHHLEVLNKVEQYGMDQKALWTVLVASGEALQQQIEVNNRVVDQANRIRHVAQPTIQITAAIRAATADAQKEMERHNQIRNLTSESLREMTRAVGQASQDVATLAQQSVIKPEALGEAMTALRQHRDSLNQSLSSALQNMREQNRRLEEAVNDGQRLIESRATNRN